MMVVRRSGGKGALTYSVPFAEEGGVVVLLVVLPALLDGWVVCVGVDVGVSNGVEVDVEVFEVDGCRDVFLLTTS